MGLFQGIVLDFVYSKLIPCSWCLSVILHRISAVPSEANLLKQLQGVAAGFEVTTIVIAELEYTPFRRNVLAASSRWKDMLLLTSCLA